MNREFEMSLFSDISIEEVQSYWDARPCNIRHSTREVGTKQYFDEVEARKYFVESHIPRFAAFDSWRDRRVLEIGCGIGTDTINFARAGAQVTAVDLSAKSLELARKRVEIFGFNNQVQFIRADAENLSAYVPPEPYDLIYSFGVIHHTLHPERIIHQIREHYTQPSSTLKFMVYHRYAWKVFWVLMKYGRGAFWRLNAVIASHSEAQSGCPVTLTYSRQDVRRLLGREFRIAEISVEHIFPYRIKDYVNYRYVKEWYFRIFPPRAFHWLEQRIGWHLCVTAHLA